MLSEKDGCERKEESRGCEKAFYLHFPNFTPRTSRQGPPKMENLGTLTRPCDGISKFDIGHKPPRHNTSAAIATANEAGAGGVSRPVIFLGYFRSMELLGRLWRNYEIQT